MKWVRGERFLSRYNIPSSEVRNGFSAWPWGSWKVRLWSSSLCSLIAMCIFMLGGRKIGGGLYTHSSIAGNGFGSEMFFGMLLLFWIIW